MRVGDKVQRYDYVDHDMVTVGPQGVVLSIEEEWDGCHSAASVRWDTGVVENEIPVIQLEVVTPKLYANIYIYDRCYGGPEEGGWWYDTYSPAGEDEYGWVREYEDYPEPPPQGLFSSEEEAAEAVEKIVEWCKIINQDRRSPSSVLSEGHFTVMQEAWPAEYLPRRKPYYC